MTSEIRTNSLKSRAGLSTVTLTDSGPMFSGITTFVDNSGFTFGVGAGSSIFTPATNTLTFGTNSTERLRITSAGQVRIETAAQGLRIGVDAANYAFTRDASGGDAGLLKFYGNQSNYTGYIFSGADGERLRIASDGNVGIGTNIPAKALEVTSNTVPQFQVGMTTTSARASLMHNGSHLYFDTTTGDQVFRTGSTSERLRIQSDGTIIFANKLTNSSAFTTHNTNFYGGDVNTGGVRIEVAHSTTTVSGNTALSSFPHHLNLTNYSGQSSADNRMVTIGFDIPTTSSHANGVIAYQATGAGQGDFSFHTETGNAIGERLRITSDGRIGIGAMADSSARLGINGSSTAELSNSSGLYNQTNPCFLQIKNSTDDITDPECGIILQPRNSQNGAVALFAKRTGSYTSDLIYRTRTGANTSLERFRIDSNGKLILSNSQGIQLSAQTSTLYAVDGSLSYYATNNGVYLNGAGASGWLRLSAAGSANNQTSMNFYGGSYGFGSGGQIDLRTNTLERFRITSGGEVILGPDATVSPVATLHVRSQGDVSGTLGSAPANIMIEAVTGNNWSSGEAGAELLFKKGGDITGAIRAEHDRTPGDHSYEDAGLAFYTAPAAESPTATRKFRVLSTGNADLTGSLSEGSDVRLKTDVVSITGALSKVNQMRGVEYKWNSVAEDNCGIRNREDGVKEIGVIADEIESIIPQVVKSDTVKGTDGTEYKGVSYDRLVPILIEAVKELSAENITLRVRVTNLEGN